MVTIQINSQAALERLIGGDSQLAIEARNSIIQNFTQKHLKSLVNLEVVQNEANKLRKDFAVLVNEKIGAEIGVIKTDGYQKVFQSALRPEIQEFLNKTIESKVYDLIKKSVEEKVASMNIEKLVKDMIDASVAYRIRDGVKKRLDEVSKTI